MFIKHYTRTDVRVPDPMRPGSTARVGRLYPSGVTTVTHEGRTYEPDANGWIDVPQDVGVELCKYRTNGSGFFTPGEVADEARLGGIDEPDSPAKRARPRATRSEG